MCHRCRRRCRCCRLTRDPPGPLPNPPGAWGPRPNPPHLAPGACSISAQRRRWPARRRGRGRLARACSAMRRVPCEELVATLRIAANLYIAVNICRLSAVEGSRTGTVEGSRRSMGSRLGTAEGSRWRTREAGRAGCGACEHGTHLSTRCRLSTSAQRTSVHRAAPRMSASTAVRKASGPQAVCTLEGCTARSHRSCRRQGWQLISREYATRLGLSSRPPPEVAAARFEPPAFRVQV